MWKRERERHFTSVRETSILLFECSQAMPTRPADKDMVRMNTLG